MASRVDDLPLWSAAALRAGAASRLAGAALAALVAASGCGASASATKPRAGSAEGAFARGSLVWPAEGRVSSRFGPRGRTHHDGIDIAAAEGTPIRVVADGTVIFSGVLRGYGNTVIVEHITGVTTVYAHNRENLVKSGTHVRRGEIIASVGQTGKTTGPNLHFEVRREKVAQDPLAFLPGKRPSSVVAQQEKPAAKRKVGVGG